MREEIPPAPPLLQRGEFFRKAELNRRSGYRGEKGLVTSTDWKPIKKALPKTQKSYIRTALCSAPKIMDQRCVIPWFRQKPLQDTARRVPTWNIFIVSGWASGSWRPTWKNKSFTIWLLSNMYEKFMKSIWRNKKGAHLYWAPPEIIDNSNRN